MGPGGIPIELADTSAWTTRHRDLSVEAAFEQGVTAGRIATCAPVRMELLWGARDEAEFAATRVELDALPRLAVGDREWQRAEDVFFELARRGPLHHRQTRFTDLLVAAAAERAGIPVLHYDRHFELIA